MRHWVGWPALDRLFSRRLPDWMAGWMAGWLVEPSLGRTLLAWQKFCAVTRAGESGAI